VEKNQKRGKNPLKSPKNKEGKQRKKRSPVSLVELTWGKVGKEKRVEEGGAVKKPKKRKHVSEKMTCQKPHLLH